MTTPNGQTPSNAANAETFAGWAQTTEGEWKDQMLGNVQQPYSGIGSWAAALKNSPLAAIPALGNIINLLTGKVDNAEKVAAQAGSVANATANVAVTQGFADGQYFIRQTYTANGTWSPPAIPPGAVRTGYGVQVIGGGEGGGKNGRGAGAGPPGGRNGGLAYRFLTVNQMGTGTRDVTIGAGGVGASAAGYGQIGGITKFSNLLSSTPGGASIQTVQGIMGSSARPGDGGRGGGVALREVSLSKTTVDVRNSWDTGSENVLKDASLNFAYTAEFGEDGESTSGAAGGRGGSPSVNNGGWFPTTTPGTNPQAGQNATADDNLASGGAGGGGGAGGASAHGQNGADGGDPGGGGGGGGAAVGSFGFLNGTQAQPGNGGNGRNGRCDVWTYYTIPDEE